jgi:hypothetical protein
LLGQFSAIISLYKKEWKKNLTIFNPASFFFGNPIGWVKSINLAAPRPIGG